MSITVYVPGDAAALALGADDVAATISATAAKYKLDIDIVRNGSRGLFWLEPLVEVVTAQGRIAYGPVTVTDDIQFVHCEFHQRRPASAALG